jgi:hypothetical protein
MKKAIIRFLDRILVQKDVSSKLVCQQLELIKIIRFDLAVHCQHQIGKNHTKQM